MISPLFVLMVLLVVALTIAEVTFENGVAVLTDSNFAEAASDFDGMLVEFYAPWCGHCKKLAPEWDKAANTLGESAIRLAKVDATENKKLAEDNGIRGFPTIKYFKGGKFVSDYNGGRTASDIVTWVNKKSGPAAKTLASVDELDNFNGVNSVFVLGAFTNAESDSAKKFLSQAASDESQIYAITSDAEVLKKLGVTADTVVVIKDFDEKRSDLVVSGDYSESSVSDFIAGATVPLIQEFSAESSKKIFSSPITRHLLFFTNKENAHHNEVVEEVRKVATDFRGKLLFVNIPSTENRVLEYFGITESDLPKVIVADMAAESGMKKYPFTGAAISGADLTPFLKEFMDGKLKPTLKSEAADPSDTTGDVVVLKGTTFNDLVINNKKDVMVEFYAPWCGHCKKLAPTWDELGAKMKGSDIVIAKMDATANEIDVPGVSVKGFPTIYFFKGNDKSNPVKYEENRELDDFVSFLSKNAHNKFSHEEL